MEFVTDETWNKNGEFSWDDKGQVIAYAEMLAHQVTKLVVRDRMQNYAVQYFAALVDVLAGDAEMDDHTRRFIAVLGRGMDNTRPLEHMEMDCDILGHALNDRLEEFRIANSVNANFESQDSQ